MTPDGYNPGAAEDPETNPDLATEEAVEELEPEDPSPAEVEHTEDTPVGDTFPTA